LNIETLNKYEIQITKIQNDYGWEIDVFVLKIWILTFDIVSDFGFRPTGVRMDVLRILSKSPAGPLRCLQPRFCLSA